MQRTFIWPLYKLILEKRLQLIEEHKKYWIRLLVPLDKYSVSSNGEVTFMPSPLFPVF